MSPEHSPLRGITLLLGALMLFAVLDATSKYLAATIAVPVLAWARYTVHLLIMVVVLGPRMRARLLRTRRLPLHLVRALLLTATTVLGMLALRTLPLAETTAVFFLSPLLVTLLAGPLLGERVTGWHGLAVALGFSGVLLIARPGGSLHGVGLAYALGGAVAYALYQLATRRLASTEQPLTTLFYTALVGTLAMSCALPWVTEWPVLTAHTGALIVSLGIYGGLGHFLLISAFRHAPASTLSPFLYIQLVWATALGWAVFSNFPDALALAGILAIAAGGGVLGWYEHRRGRTGRNDPQRAVTTGPGGPGGGDKIRA